MTDLSTLRDIPQRTLKQFFLMQVIILQTNTMTE